MQNEMKCGEMMRSGVSRQVVGRFEHSYSYANTNLREHLLS